VALSSLWTNPKFRRLVHELREPVPHVLGYLECLWNTAYQAANPRIGDAIDVELAAEYPGERGKLFKALVACRFLDEESGVFFVHDFWDHAPHYVKNRAQEKTCAHCSTVFRSTQAHAMYCSPACRTAAYRHRLVTDGDGALRHGDAPVTEGSVTLRHSNVTVAERDALPNPTQPNQEEDTTSPRRGEVRLSPEEFLKAWNRCGGFTHCRKMTGKRLTALRARAADADWLAHWREALARAAASPFCTGGGDRGWRADVDWFLRPDTLNKILEGKYDGKSSNGQPAAETAEQRLARQQDEARARREEKAQRLQAVEAERNGVVAHNQGGGACPPK
jgi:hypothetical protein